MPGFSMSSYFQSMFIESSQHVLEWVVTARSSRNESSTFCTSTSISFTSGKHYTPHPLPLTTRLLLSRVISVLRWLESMWVYWTIMGLFLSESWADYVSNKLKAVLSVRPGSIGAPSGTLLQIASCIPAFSTGGKGALGPPLSAPAGVSKRETPTSILTESTVNGSVGSLFWTNILEAIHLISKMKPLYYDK